MKAVKKNTNNLDLLYRYYTFVASKVDDLIIHPAG